MKTIHRCFLGLLPLLFTGFDFSAAASLQFTSSKQVNTGTPPAYDSGTGDHSMARGDFTGDGLEDLVYLNP